MEPHAKANHIASCLELAILLEVSAHKPGNVSLVTNFENTRHEHFLASAVAARPSFMDAAARGIAVSKGEIPVSEVKVGRIIKNCVADINSWQHGGNTLLGATILFCPIAVATGMSAETEGSFEISKLRERMRRIVESTTPEDAVNVYEAIAIANPGGLGKVRKLDVNEPDSKAKILREGVSLFEVFKLASTYDTICSEWVNNYPISFDFAYPHLARQIMEGKDLNTAIIHTFLKVLAEYPDSFIARKVGTEKAREVSSMAEEVLHLGGLETPNGKKSLSEFDLRLRESGNLLNPGTTADIVAAALGLCVLGGYRP
jgi:triphosphoribosyl-dephospho-CoA synthase